MAHRKGRKPQILPQKSNEAGPNRRPSGRTRRSKASGLWIYGVHAVTAVMRNPARTIERLVVSPEAARRLDAEIDTAAAERNIKPEALNQRGIQAELPAGAVHQGVAVLTSPLANPDFEQVCTPTPGDRATVLVLDQITDPRNFGAILRSAGAFGALAVVATDRHAPPESGALAKAASGALETVPVVRVTNLARALDTLADLGYWRTGLAAEGTQPLIARPDRSAIALVLGAEGSGLRRLTTEHCDSLEKIPAGGLNVSVAAAVALYELTRATHQT
ncbi:MAG: 23S rRNA (guanosine(2251)-2'-O)-methyltransferase RlmB [Alphaproteobacteria bacterium]|nr:23S rRNA (guanosine(2251)-2'-O)-methyltransferase RlmB [Alphaproteobacteria bacterium]MBT5860740.1 23S rRNA (guanosine(2251)-2'-O)-methyltransferase RlmB [Alphaproteobacteria bacterium]